MLRAGIKLSAVLMFSLTCAMPVIAHAAKPLVTGASQYTAFVPKGDATADNPYTLNIPIPDPADNTKRKNVQVEVTFAKQLAGETPAQASQRKAKAVVDAIKDAVKAGTLPNTASASLTTRQIQVPDGTFRNTIIFGRVVQVPNLIFITDPNAWGTYRIDGVVAAVQLVKNKKGIVDPSKQGVGGLNFTPGAPNNPSQDYKPSMSGSGLSATGVDPTGSQSIVTFGFFDASHLTQCTSTDISGCPPVFIDGIAPLTGESDSQVLSDLAAVFNRDFVSSGFTLNFDPASDTLSLAGSLPWNFTFQFGSSDTGLNLSADLVPTPEPSTLGLLATGLTALGVVCRWRRRFRW